MTLFQQKKVGFLDYKHFGAEYVFPCNLFCASLASIR